MSSSSDEINDPVLKTETIEDIQIRGEKVKRINSFTESFGNIDDGEYLKKAYIIKRNDSIELNNKDEKRQDRHMKKFFDSREGEFFAEHVKSRKKEKGQIHEDEIKEDIAMQDEFIPEEDFYLANEMKEENEIESESRSKKQTNVGHQTEKFTMTVDGSQNSKKSLHFVSYAASSMAPNDRYESQVNIKLKNSVKRDNHKVSLSENLQEKSELQRNDSWDALDVRKHGNNVDQKIDSERNSSFAAKNTPDKLKVSLMFFTPH